MGFKFTFLCDLLSSLEDNTVARATAVKKDTVDIRTIGQWFARHDRHIHHADTDRLALLSCMFPERRIDRVYWLQATSLARVIARCLGLGSSRLAELDQWRKSGGPDLGQCVENVMRQAENDVPQSREVTVEEIDLALGMIASRCRFSGPQVRRQKTAVDVEGALSPLYRRLSSRDAKWLTRMILKSYPVVLPQKYTLDRFHFLLPYLLQFQDTFEGALQILSSEPMNHFPSRPDPRLAANLCSIALEHLQPRPGVKIGRPEYFKARSIKDCHQMAKRRRMSIERKYDGEYCQVHIDLTNKQNPVQIFSKSGKDSTADRFGIIPTVEESLQMETAKCKFARHCILEGELLVWSEKQNGVADFHKLRKFLPRSGTFIGIDSDSPPQPYEHLMIVFFDILLFDNDVCLRAPYRQRRRLLQDVVHTIPGRAAIAEQEILDFSRPDSRDRLEVSFANAIAQRWEGYVLKACDEPYFPMYSAGVDMAFGRWIKLKKDYIPGLGDTVDLALIGGYYDAHDAAASFKSLRWTHLLVGCLLNKDDVELSAAVPRFKVIDVVNHHCMHRDILQYLNQIGEFHACDPEDFQGFDLEYGHANLPRASNLFKKPFVVEMMGSGFGKPSNARYFTLRFPRILKVHTDRTFQDAASHRELQLSAEEARSIPVDDIFKERDEWRKRLKAGNGLNQYIVQRSRSPSSRSSSVEPNADSEADGSSVTSHDDEDSFYSLRNEGHAHQTRSTGRGPQHNSGAASAVYIDETSFPEKLQSPQNDGVLAENENLSRRRSCSQTGANTLAQTLNKSGKFSLSKVPMKAMPTISSNSQISRIVSTHHAHAPRSHPMAASSNEDEPRSPLTTIPVYMSDTPSNLRPKPKGSAGLDKFLQALGSTESRTSLRQSNPKAVSKGIAFGIALVNPRVSSLGQEIHQIALAVRGFRARQSCLPSGRIFFLDSGIVKEDVHHEDLQFCLRATWVDLGQKYYYACLHWDLGPDSSREVGQSIRCHAQLDTRYKSSEPGKIPPVAVSFDPNEILALGEYRSINPLLHVDK